eukprot:TRINITY_DN7851_c0_g1_i4.p1 TRINITY_DN7851_c0_g1~~TRINITY_DN7851_c0_g1_i4.p1  ORF type:complete len:158 (-),score=44.96 TRINITY_DN7851_c0_g1_i4:27-500(-)
MIRRPPRSTLSSSSAASDVYKRQVQFGHYAMPEEATELGKADEEDDWMTNHLKVLSEQKVSARRSTAICGVLREFRAEAFDSATEALKAEGAGNRARARMHAAISSEDSLQERCKHAMDVLQRRCSPQKVAKLEASLLADIERMSKDHDERMLATPE